jgi:hypothetical protein
LFRPNVGEATMKLTEPSGRLERLGLLKHGPGLMILPKAVFCFRKELGLDRNALLVILSVLSHARAGSPDYCEVAYSIIERDTGLHPGIICRCVRLLTAARGADVRVSKRSRTSEGMPIKKVVAMQGLGLLALAPRPEHLTPTGRRTKFVFRDNGPRRDTNVYLVAPLADRLDALLRSDHAARAVLLAASATLRAHAPGPREVGEGPEHPDGLTDEESEAEWQGRFQPDDEADMQFNPNEDGDENGEQHDADECT